MAAKVFVEYDQYLNRFSGQQAMIRRVGIRLSMTPNDIPYYSKGFDPKLFDYGSQAIASLRAALADIDPTLKVDSTQGRVTLVTAQLSFPIPTSDAAPGGFNPNA